MSDVIRLADYREPPYRTPFVQDMNFDIRDGETFVTTTFTVTRTGDHAQPVVLNAAHMDILDVTVAGVPMGASDDIDTGYVYDADAQTLTFQPPADAEFTVTTRVRIVPEENKAYEGLYKSGPLYVTQLEPEGFRRVTPFIDRPDNMTVFERVRVEADASLPTLLSNGNCLETGETPDGRRYAVWQDPFPKPCYLFAVVAADLQYLEDTYETMSGRMVTLRIYGDAIDLPNLGFAMQSLKDAMKWDEDTYGREYDLDLYQIVAVTHFNFAGMENKGLNIFNINYVAAHPDTKTDDNFLAIKRVIGHEYFHNWTGNRITCRDWFQLTLKEGLTVLREAQFMADTGSPIVARLTGVDVIRLSQFASDAGPLAHPIKPRQYESVENFYTSTVYRKGAEVIRMMHTLVGPDAFRKGMDLYFERHDGQAATTEDFVAAIADGAGYDMTQFAKWYDQVGTPEIAASWQHDPRTNRLTLTLSQKMTRYIDPATSGPLVIPVRFGLVGPGGRAVPLNAAGDTETVLTLDGYRQVFTFDNVPIGTVPSLLRNFSAPVRLDAPYTDDDLLHLMVFDADEFNRIDAGQRLLINKMVAQIARATDGDEIIVDPAVIRAVEAILDRDDISPIVKSKLLALPAFDELSPFSTPIDPIAITAVREAFHARIGAAFADQWRALYETMTPAENTPFSADPDAMARRALRNMALNFLRGGAAADVADLAASQYANAANMTERTGALNVLVNTDGADAAAAAALADYHQRFEYDPKILINWFKTQAMASSATAMDNIEKLPLHPSFDAHTPNFVLGLYGVFTAGNHKLFHDPSGRGYRFVADFIIQIDRENPKMSGRLFEPFARYEEFAQPHRDLMEAQILRIATQNNLSADLAEKIRKTLGIEEDGQDETGAKPAPSAV